VGFSFRREVHGHIFLLIFGQNPEKPPVDIEEGTCFLGMEVNLMTKEQKNKIEVLRGQGYGYATVADAVGLSKDSVKAYCRNHGLAGKLADNTRIKLTADNCPNCGKPVAQVPGRKTKRFCSAECRQAWWNAHQDQVKQKAVYSFTCACCGQSFSA